MNYSIISKMLSMVLGIMAVAFSACAGVSAFYGNTPLESEAMQSWICSVALSTMLSFAFYLPSRNAPKKLFKKEAMCVVGVGWTLASIVGTLPYVLILHCDFGHAFFESTSGITTTGASVFGDFSDFPHSLMFWRCLSHWIGGMGVLVFFVAILSFLGSGGRILYASETSAASGGGIETARIQSGVLRIFTLYIAISAACLGAFKLCGMGWFDGICHAFSVVSTGGFSCYEDSIAHYDSMLIDWIVIFFMFVGGVSFMLMLSLTEGKFGRLLKNTEFWTYTIIMTLASAIIAIFIIKDVASTNDWSKAITDATFQSVSVMTTTGLASANYEGWIPVTHVLLLILMTIGGCAGSTAGGIKVSRLVSATKIVWRDIEKSYRPRVVRQIALNGKTLDDDGIGSVLSFTTMFCLIALASFATLSLLEPNMSLTGCVSAVIACMNNVGPGFNEVGPAQNYGFLSNASKIFLAVLMIMGRLEFYAILVLFMPSLWKKFQ